LAGRVPGYGATPKKGAGTPFEEAKKLDHDQEKKEKKTGRKDGEKGRGKGDRKKPTRGEQSSWKTQKNALKGWLRWVGPRPNRAQKDDVYTGKSFPKKGGERSALKPQIKLTAQYLQEDESGKKKYQTGGTKKVKGGRRVKA